MRQCCPDPGSLRVSHINVLVAAASPDVKAEVIAESVAARPDMTLVEGCPVPADDVDALLERIPATSRCAIAVVGDPAETEELARLWLARRSDLVVMLVDVVEDIVRIALRDPHLDSLLSALRDLVDRVRVEDGQERVARVELRSDGPALVGAEPTPRERPLLSAAIDWLRTTLRRSIERVPDDNGDVHGLSLTRATLLESFEPVIERDAEASPGAPDADEALDAALAAADPATEPLAAAARVFALGPLEFRMLLLGLAPELDLRFQRCIGFLLDDMSRRVGTIALYTGLLGPVADVRGALARSGALDGWLVFEGGRQLGADEALRIDPSLARWLLGERDALADDPRVRRVLRLAPWPGAELLQRREERLKAACLMEALLDQPAARWLLLDGDDPAAWRALFEAGAVARRVQPIRVDAGRLPEADPLDIEDCGRRIGRAARLTGRPLVVDAAADTRENDDPHRLFLAAAHATGCRAAVIGTDEARLVRAMAPAPFDLRHAEALPAAARTAAVRAAAAGADTYLAEDEASALAARYPLSLDGLEHAMSLARSRPLDFDADNPRVARLMAALKEVATTGLSHLAEVIEPVFSLDDVVLPADRKQQLVEIVDNVRLESRVLDEWKFRDLLPYGRGVSALFFGPPGTGKTMAAIGIARTLGVQLLRLDLSRVVSKFIGETEKNLARVFADAERSGAAILIDEADALVGKRSEVKDAHDRYANIEVAYLLQRMEAYRGLAILTTNMRQSLDPAFLRRLRFSLDFPRPDLDAREQIWRQCLPAGSHEVDEAGFRLLARRIDLTGGHIRQITLRAAFIAAAADTRIGLPHLAHAARAELAKLGMPAVDLDAGAGRQAA